MKYRKRPVVIEAFKFDGPFSVADMIKVWGKPFKDQITFKSGVLVIRTIDGGYCTPDIGDWVIKGNAVRLSLPPSAAALRGQLPVFA